MEDVRWAGVVVEDGGGCENVAVNGADVKHECLCRGVTSRSATARTASRVTADSVKGEHTAEHWGTAYPIQSHQLRPQRAPANVHFQPDPTEDPSSTRNPFSLPATNPLSTPSAKSIRPGGPTGG